ncbi:hypothetical protein M8494_36530 [Serratia ureilytica]
MKILARLLHLDRLLPAMDAKLLSLMLDGSTPSPPTGLCSRSRARNPLFGDFSRLTLAILNQTGAYQEPTKTSAIPFIPYRLLCSHAGVVSCRMYVIGRVRYFPCPGIRLVEVLPDTTFEIDNTLISLIEQSDFMEALPT